MDKKVIVFDFDGTLSKKETNIWKALWQSVGYSVDRQSDFAKLYVSFMKGEITHQKWCDLTCDFLREGGLNRDLLLCIAQKYQLMNGFEKTIKTLKDAGYELHIVSGGVKPVINYLIKDYRDCFASVNANDLLFDNDGRLSEIRGTKYDFEGKAIFINELLCENEGLTSSDITFVGNGDNDEWAYKSGCNTLCINPDNTDSSNRTIWHDAIDNVESLTQILSKFTVQNEHTKYIDF